MVIYFIFRRTKDFDARLNTRNHPWSLNEKEINKT